MAVPADDESAHNESPKHEIRLLNYTSIAVAMIQNPPAIGALICALMPGLIIIGLWILERGRVAFLRTFYGNVLGWFGMLAIALALIGLWLARDPKFLVAGRSIGRIALLLGGADLCLGLLISNGAL